jgi:hypothetical protein
LIFGIKVASTLNRNAYKLEQNNKIQQQILKVVLLMIPLDEEELNSEHEVKQAGPAVKSVKDVVQRRKLSKTTNSISSGMLQFIEANKTGIPH